MKKSNQKVDSSTPSANSVMGQPKTVFELINKYGTYNIQPTSDSDNEFPEIAQGFTTKGKRSKR